MTTIYQSDTERVQGKKDLQNLLVKLPESMHKRALRYKFEQDAVNFVVGRLLLKEGLELLNKGDQFECIEFQKSGKPFLNDVFFNISHSGNKVVCALSTEGEIGIDIEKLKQVELDNFKPFFTNIEWVGINNASSPLQKFYWYWTRKESIIKALGVNLSHLHKIELDATKDHFLENGKKWYLRDLDLGQDFFGAICSSYPITDFRLLNKS